MNRHGLLIVPAFLALLAAAPRSAAAQDAPLPAELAFLSAPLKPYRIAYEPWAEELIPPGNYGANGVGKVVSGKHWQFPVIVPGAMTPDAVWAVMKPAFLTHDWTTVREWTSGGLVLWVHYAKNGVEAWAVLDTSGAERAGVEIVEAAPLPFKLSLAPPAAVPEKVDAAVGDFPYLAALPGSKLRSGVVDTTPFTVTLKGASQPEIVAPGSMLKTYVQSEALSNSLFHASYRDALLKAGWTIVTDFMGADVAITAHYAQHGRDLWVALHKGGDAFDVRIADAGVKDLGADLKKKCHVALYGVLFDFDKSTLQTVSEPKLQEILSVLTKAPALHLEIQGHTDDVGDDAYNQKLSEARARAVVAWLVKSGVPAARLSARGYGKAVPIADNRTDEGRAKNRRVELADPRCAARP